MPHSATLISTEYDTLAPTSGLSIDHLCCIIVGSVGGPIGSPHQKPPRAGTGFHAEGAAHPNAWARQIDPCGDPPPNLTAR